MEQSLYEQDRKASLDAEYSDAEHYDKWLLTLSSGAFGVSVAFIRYIAPNPISASKTFLILAWCFLLASILATMTSLQLSQIAFRRYREILDELRQGPQTRGPTNLSGSFVLILNWLSLFLFVAGAAMLAVFTFINLAELQGP